MTKGPVAEGLGRVEELSDAGHYQAALEELDRQLEEHPNESAVHTARGWALENLGPGGLAGARDAYARAGARPHRAVGEGGSLQRVPADG